MKLTILFPIIVLMSVIASTLAFYKKCYDHLSIGLCITTENETSLVFSPGHKTWESAKQWCDRNSSSLAAISDEKVQYAVTDFIASPSADMDNENIFIDGWRLTTQDLYWVDGRASGLSSKNVDQRYGFLKRTDKGNYHAYVNTGTEEKKFICSSNDTSDSRCENIAPLTGRCYIVFNVDKTWFDARIHCLKEKADLAIFGGNFNFSRMFSNLQNEYWIGLRSETLYWSNGLQMNYYNWLKEDPNWKYGECLCIKKSTGKWRNCNCEEKYRFICIQDSIITSDSTWTATQPMKFASQTLTSMMQHKTEPVTEGSDSLQNVSNSPFSFSGMVGLGIVAFLLIVAISALIVFVVRTKRKRGGASSKSVGESDRRPKPKQLCLSDDASVGVYAEIAGSPDTVYAKVVPSERTMSEADKTPTKMIYVQLDMAPKINESGAEEQSSQFLKPPETVYANYIAHDVQ